jgi:hypothetical protein
MITQDIARVAFQTFDLDALGITSGQIGVSWATAPITFDPATLRLNTTAHWKAIAAGSIHWRPFGATDLYDVAGAPLGNGLTSPGMAVFRLHPQAHLRLARLYAQRFEGNTQGRSTRPVPYAIAFHNPDMPNELVPSTVVPPPENSVKPTDPPPKPELVRVGDQLHEGDWDLTGTISIHDERGLIIDPVAVACALRELMQAWTDLRSGNTADLTGSADGSLGQICGLATGRQVHFVDLHGNNYVAPASGGIQIGSAGAVSHHGPHAWADGQTIATVSGSSTNLRLGFATHGTLGTAAVSVPSFPATAIPSGSSNPVLARDFFRVAVVDLGLHLLGNRSDDAVDGVPAPDEHTRAEADPEVRDTEAITALLDGITVLGTMQTIRSAAGKVATYAVAPIVATDFDLPADATATSRWPAAPAIPSGVTAGSWDPSQSARVRTSWTANFIGSGNDVELTLPAGIIPQAAHVRVFPRVFIEGPALADSPSAKRGDGNSTLVGTGDVRIILRDPLNVGTTGRPNPARLRFDVIVVPRPATGPTRERLFGGLSISIGTGGNDLTPPAPTRSLSDVPVSRRGESRSPFLGLPPAAPASGTLTQVLQALGEAEPREAPRFPTMARHDALLAARTGASPAVWDAVITNGWLAERSRESLRRLGNPGNRGAPEERVVGLAVGNGRLAHDLGRAALRRTRHLVTRLIELNGGEFNLAAVGTGTDAGAVLQTIAPVCENPEASLLSNPSTLPNDWAALVAAVGASIPGLSSLGSPTAGDRWVAETKREAMAAKHGRRDAQWALRWQIAHARKLIYIESMLFSRSAGTSVVASHAFDFVAALRDRLTAMPDLRVILSLPREIPVGPGYQGWGKYFHNARNGALDSLMTAAPGRVLVYHPVGFPGRPELVRGNVVIVDDVWAMVGTSTLSRRGLTFDGGLDLSFCDRNLRDGYSIKVRDLRRSLMARTLGKAAPTDTNATPDPNWVRLAQMRGAFEVIREVLEHGGEGLLLPLWRGPSNDEVIAQDDGIADPEGRDFNAAMAAFAGALTSLGPSGV